MSSYRLGDLCAEGTRRQKGSPPVITRSPETHNICFPPIRAKRPHSSPSARQSPMWPGDRPPRPAPPPVAVFPPIANVAADTPPGPAPQEREMAAGHTLRCLLPSRISGVLGFFCWRKAHEDQTHTHTHTSCDNAVARAAQNTCSPPTRAKHPHRSPSSRQSPMWPGDTPPRPAPQARDMAVGHTHLCVCWQVEYRVLVFRFFKNFRHWDLHRQVRLENLCNIHQLSSKSEPRKRIAKKGST